jgi:hypothetical protein
MKYTSLFSEAFQYIKLGCSNEEFPLFKEGTSSMQYIKNYNVYLNQIFFLNQSRMSWSHGTEMLLQELDEVLLLQLE